MSYLVFGDGQTDARTIESLLIQKLFFDVNMKAKKFKVRLNVTNTVFNGRKHISSNGISEMTIVVNPPPENGTCIIPKRVIKDDNTTTWIRASEGRALLDLYTIKCQSWVDPEGHSVVKYVFNAKKLSDGSIFPLFAGPRSELTVILQAGKYDILAQIHESQGAYRDVAIAKNFNSYIPSEEDYKNFDIEKEKKYYMSIGDKDKVTQILAAQVRSLPNLSFSIN